MLIEKGWIFLLNYKELGLSFCHFHTAKITFFIPFLIDR